LSELFSGLDLSALFDGLFDGL